MNTTLLRKKKLLLTILLLGSIASFCQHLTSANSENMVSSLPQMRAQTTLKSLLLSYEETYQVSIIFNSHKIGSERVIPPKDERLSLELKLKLLLTSLGLQFKQLDKNVFIIQQNEQTDQKALGKRRHLSSQTATLHVDSSPSITPILATEYIRSVSPEQTISGTVTNEETGEGVPGATVLAIGTTKGTVTDSDGKYTITLDDNVTTLRFSSIGYVAQEVLIEGRSQIDIQLVPDITSLSEVVVIGYGSVEKSDVTGAVSSLSEDDFNPGANSSIDQLMIGKIAGVQINQTSSEPGGGLSIRIRGASSINAGNEPLYVIDGFPIDNSTLLPGGGVAQTGNNQNPRNPLNALNPSDIESIEILKDASATAIYGSRGANGVILVTTKKGSRGGINITYDFYGGTQSVYEKMDIMNTEEYINGINGISIDRGDGPVFTDADIKAIGAGTDWQDQIYREAPIFNHNLSASGGDENTNFFVSLNYFDQEGIIINSGIEKYIGRVNLERSIGDKAKIGVNINTSLIKDENNVDGLNINEVAGPIYTSLLYDPTEPIFDDEGNFTQSPNLTINNPLSVAEGVSSENETNRTLGNLFIEYNFTPELSGKLNFGSDRQISRRDIYNSTKTIRGGAANGIANIATLERSNVLLEYSMTYSKTFNQIHDFVVLGGVTYQNFVSKAFNGNISNFPSDVLGTDNLSLGDTGNDNLNSNQEENSLLSYLGRINYNLKDRYLLTFSMRADGSSRFGENYKFGYFPAVAVGWKLAEEEFIPDFFDELKLRGSWGQTGNQEIGNYASLLTFGTGPTAVFNDQAVSSADPTRIANPDLKWETTEQLNIGIDASILNGRVSTTLDYFIKTTSDMLINLPLPRTTGYNSILSNIGEMENKGFEFLLNTTNIVTPSFTWSTSLNFSAIRNEVTDLGPVGDIVTGNIQDVGNTSIIREGEPLASYFGYEVTGIFQEGDNIESSPQPNSQPGYPIFRDVNGDNTITPADQVLLGDPFPDFTYGIQNSFTFKDFQLDIFFQGQQGGDLLNINVIESMFPANFRRNRLANQVLDRWTPQNTDTRWPSGVNPFAYEGGKVTSLVLQDASYLRLRNARISYNVPLAGIKYLRTATVYVTGQNIFTITDYTGFDPEANSFGRSNVRVDYSSYPLARTWLFGATIGL